MNTKPTVNLNRLERLMSERNWSIADLAEYSGVKYNTVYSLCTGRRVNTSSRTLMKIAEALDTSADYLLGETEEEKPPLQKLPRQVRQLAEVARKLSEPRQEELLRIAALIDELDRERQTEERADEMSQLLASIKGTTEGDEVRKELKKLLSTRGYRLKPTT
jgi:transcriptional regulator with XRE-family HTH domain